MYKNLQQMGNSSETGDSLKHDFYSDKFRASIKYYSEATDPVTKNTVKVYSYDEIFVHREDMYFSRKQQLLEFQELILHLTSPSKADSRRKLQNPGLPMCLQTIYHIENKKYIELCADINFKTQIYKEHFNYTLKEHLQAIQIKINEYEGESIHKLYNGLSRPQLLYILKQLAQVGAYLDRHRLSWRRLDAQSIYIDAGYQVRIPIAYISKREHKVNSRDQNFSKNKADRYYRNMELNQSLLFAPEQINTGEELYASSNISKVFTLGLVILECYSLLDSFVNYYYSPLLVQRHPSITGPRSAYRINLQKLNQDLKELPNEKLSGILSRMLQVDPKKRISFAKLVEVLQAIDPNQFQNCLIIQ